MLPLMYPVLLAQAPAAFVSPAPPAQRYIVEQQDVRPLPGQLDNIPVFNSNSPEVIEGAGILLSTFPRSGTTHPHAHLNQTLEGRFDFFSHHISRPAGEKLTLYQGVLVYNASSRPVTLQVHQAVSYLNSHDAPFIDLPAQLEDPYGSIYSGPGSRLAGDVIRGVNQPYFPSQLVLRPRELRMLAVMPIPVSSARSTLMRLESSGPVYMANLALYEMPEYTSVLDLNDPTNEEPVTKVTYNPPTMRDWQNLLTQGRLATPRDRAPSNSTERYIYGRVAGISVGSEWNATLTDQPNGNTLTIPQPGESFSYPLSTTDTGTHGTDQIQSAPMLVRYSDTALRAHGNYAVHYNLKLPLHNDTNRTQTVFVTVQTPLKKSHLDDRLVFLNPPEDRIFFRGSVRLRYRDDFGRDQERYFHLVQRQGQRAEPLIEVRLRPGDRRDVQVDFLYPPDATPPQVLTVSTLGRRNLAIESPSPNPPQ
ncbi:DUF3370 domain-containing protein [Spirulina major]|uniref:DUF3370 domain-containing protein n=1 Tax=Spirulina major TaxID=270636 RepID=UPI000933E9E3|nr:DUF3370 domain-containing protein [Spirulina major]